MHGGPRDKEDLPFATSLCHGCAHHRYSGNRRGSIFIMCQGTPYKYVPQPVLRCPAFEPEAEDSTDKETP